MVFIIARGKSGGRVLLVRAVDRGTVEEMLVFDEGTEIIASFDDDVIESLIKSDFAVIS